MADYYEILGVSKEATSDEIKKAYRKLAHKHHPDKTGGDDKKFKEINEAYQTLSDETKRSQYDQFGKDFNQNGGTQGGAGFDFSGFSSQGTGGGFEFGGGDFEDIFSNIFGGGSSRSRSKSRNRGQDIQLDMEITFEEMISGVKKKVNLYKRVECDRCNGTGGEPGSQIKTCPTCHGTGQVQKITKSFFGSFSQMGICSNCQGEGKIYDKKCSKCGGDGRVKEQQAVEINIPAGIADGQTLSIQGAGEAGGKGSMAGDLYILIHVIPHKKFERKGQDIISTEEISLSTAILGDKIEIETLYGKLILSIPAGTQSGEIFRIKNKGVPEINGGGQGNQLVKVIVRIPKKISRAQKKLVEKIRDLGE